MRNFIRVLSRNLRGFARVMVRVMEWCEYKKYCIKFKMGLGIKRVGWYKVTLLFIYIYMLLMVIF